MSEPIKKSTVLQDLITAMEAGQLIPSKHALEQMKARDLDLSDIEEAAYRAYREAHKDQLTDDKQEWKYAIRGLNDLGDKDIRIVLVYLESPKMLIITAIDKNK
jgi:nitroreductase